MPRFKHDRRVLIEETKSGVIVHFTDRLGTVSYAKYTVDELDLLADELFNWKLDREIAAAIRGDT